MNFEEMQKAWQSQGAGPKITIDADVILKEVRRNQYSFRGMIFWRDFREVGVAAWLTWLFLHWAIRDKMWPLYLLSFGCFFVGVFILVDRWIQQKRQPVLNDSLKAWTENSLLHVNHQIWLLKNVFWWYLLPLCIGEAVFLLYLAWRTGFSDKISAERIVPLAVMAVIFGLVDGGVYWLNQFAVRKALEPRRQELETLLAELK